MLTELANRGVGDVLIVCCDGLKGLPDAIEATWPKATVQTCVVHLLRNSMSYAGWKDRRQIAKELRPVYTAADADTAEAALEAFEAGIGARYPAIGQIWRRQWEQFTPFPELPARHPKSDLHHQHDREHQPAAPQGRQEPRALTATSEQPSSCCTSPCATSPPPEAAPPAPEPKDGPNASTSSPSATQDDSP